MQNPTSDPSNHARNLGGEAQFKTLHYYFGVNVCELILQHTDPKISASVGANIAAMAVTIL